MWLRCSSLSITKTDVSYNTYPTGTASPVLFLTQTRVSSGMILCLLCKVIHLILMETMKLFYVLKEGHNESLEVLFILFREWLTRSKTFFTSPSSISIAFEVSQASDCHPYILSPQPQLELSSLLPQLLFLGMFWSPTNWHRVLE